MSKVVTLPTPTPEITVMSEKEIKEFTPQYAQVKAIPKLYGISRTTAYRLIKRSKELGYEDIEISVSANCKLIHLVNFNKFLHEQNGKHY